MAGLTAAYVLGRDGKHEVVLLEASDRLGGKVATEQVGDLLVERGPDSVFSMKPAAVELMAELGMEDEIIGPKGNEFSILVGGRLHHVPRALATLMPSASGVLEKVGFLSAAAKKRVLSEKEAPKGSGQDESIASFFRRRFGKKFSMLVAEPLLAGIHAGDPEKLSMKALYPTYLGMEQKNGSLTGTTPPPPPPPGSPAPRRPAFVALRGGMASLVRRLEESMQGVEVRKGVPVSSIEKDGERLRVIADKPYVADHVVLGIPAYVATCLLADLAPEAAGVLQRIRYVSTAVVTLAYPAAAFPKGLYGNGFLVPYSESGDITGCTWSSMKWEGRAPDDVVLLRVFMGRDGGLNVDDHSDESLIEIARNAIEKIMEPKLLASFERADRWPRSMPQYEIGHLDLLTEAEQGLHGLPISLVGSSYRGNGIPDCVRQGREAAHRLLQSLT